MPLFKLIGVSPITSSTITLSDFSSATFSVSNSHSTRSSSSRSIFTPFISISQRNKSISCMKGITFLRDLLWSRSNITCWARNSSPQAFTSASAYSFTISKGISSKPSPSTLNISSIRSDFFRLFTLRLMALSFNERGLRCPLASKYSMIIVSKTIGGSLNPISCSHSASNLVLWQMIPSAASKSASRAIVGSQPS